MTHGHIVESAYVQHSQWLHHNAPHRVARVRTPFARIFPNVIGSNVIPVTGNRYRRAAQAVDNFLKTTTPYIRQRYNFTGADAWLNSNPGQR
jgi:hypothetical protein